MKKVFSKIAIFLILCILVLFLREISFDKSLQVLSVKIKPSYWFILHRKSNIEYLYLGVPGEIEKSKLVKTFKVKTGIPKESPTPLPQLLGRKYWKIVGKQKEEENPETMPYFLTLDIPVSESTPFGPIPYLECSVTPGGELKQCNWGKPGYFGLHGVGEDLTRLSSEDPGSFGCIRHSNEDITYLFNLLNPKEEEIRYYIQNS